jgi:hypothetical protein
MGGQPQQAVQRGYVIKVVNAMTLSWKNPAHVVGNRIQGSVEVSNATVDDIDLTFDVKAVADNGRATEIGYQHFVLTRGTIGMALPFGETLPHGALSGERQPGGRSCEDPCHLPANVADAGSVAGGDRAVEAGSAPYVPTF